MIERQRKEVKVDWGHTYVVKCSRLRWYKRVFPGAFLSLNKALFLFFCVFWGWKDIFLLDSYRIWVKHWLCGWNIGNAGEMKLKFSGGWESWNADDTCSMRVSSHIWTVSLFNLHVMFTPWSSSHLYFPPVVEYWAPTWIPLLFDNKK